MGNILFDLAYFWVYYFTRLNIEISNDQFITHCGIKARNDFQVFKAFTIILINTINASWNYVDSFMRIL